MRFEYAIRELLQKCVWIFEVRNFNAGNKCDGITVAARINGMHLIGLRYPWLENITEPRNGVAFVAASHERGRGTRHYDSFVFRVSGL